MPETSTTKDAALLAIEQAVLGYYSGELVQREMMAEIVMTLEGVGYMPRREGLRRVEDSVAA